MKIFKLSFFIPLFLLLNTAYAQESNTNKFKQLAWLTGKWIRTNPKAGQSGYETWAKSTGLKLIGKGVTLKGDKPIFTENLEFIIKGKDIYYAVVIDTEPQPTYFKLSYLAPNEFTCENPEHDFPKKISYKRNGKTMKAVISGNGQSVTFEFRKDK